MTRLLFINHLIYKAIKTGSLALFIVMVASAVNLNSLKAQEANNSSLPISTNSKEPIDIESDKLKVNDNKKTAIFSGNVRAVQGKFVLKSSELEVLYSGDPTKKDAKNEVSKLSATGDVHIVTPDGQTVTSETAIFDVKAQIINFDGDVTVNQNGNLVRSSGLTINLKTRESSFKSGKKNGKRQRIQMKVLPGSQSPASN